MAFCFEGRRSIQLSYGSTNLKSSVVSYFMDSAEHDLSYYEPTRSRAAVGEVITFFHLFLVTSNPFFGFSCPNATYSEF